MPRSNSRTLDLGAVGTPQFLALVDMPASGVAARTLRIKSRLLVPGESDEQQISLAQGLISSVWWTDPPWHLRYQNLGCMRLRFGSRAGIFRDVYADLREGEYNLPPCEIVSVNVAYWRSYEAQDSHQLEVAAEIADGATIESSPLIFTAARDIDIAGGDGDFNTIPGSRFCPAPPGAYAFDVQAGQHTGIVASGTQNGFGPPALYVERDVSTGRWLPPTTPVLLGEQRGLVVWPLNPPDVGTYWAPQITYFVR